MLSAYVPDGTHQPTKLSVADIPVLLGVTLTHPSMTSYELLTTLVAILALVISAVSLFRTRKTAEMQIELARVSSKLAEKQLERLIVDEPLEGQPVFAIRVTAIGGVGDYPSPQYEVRIRIKIDNTGPKYLQPSGVQLVTLDGGIYKLPHQAEVEFKGGPDRDEIEREHVIRIRPGADLLACSLHVSYIDNTGKDKIQEFRVIPEGGFDSLPSAVFFQFSRVITMVPGSTWSLK